MIQPTSTTLPSRLRRRRGCKRLGAAPHSASAVVVCALLCLSAVGPEARASRPTTPSAGGGPTEAIVLEKLWSVGDGPGEEKLVCTVDTMLAASSSNKQFYVGPTCLRGQVAALDAGGNLTGFIGSEGQGPGELEAVATIFVDRRDQLHVFQIPRGHTVFGSDHQFVRSFQRWPLPGWAVFLDGGTSVRNLLLKTPDRVGKPLSIVDDSTNELLLSFGEDVTAVVDASDNGGQFRSISAGQGTSYWSAKPFDYALQQWDASGRELRTLVRQPEWWIRKPGYGTTWLRDIRVDGNLVWTLSIVPTFDGESPGKVGKGPGLNNYFDTVFEVLALDTEQLVATTRTDVVFSRWVGDLVFSHRDLEEGIVAMDVWRAHLSGSTGLELATSKWRRIR